MCLTSPQSNEMQNSTKMATCCSSGRAASKTLPPFYRANPCLWFHQVEAHFALAGISLDDEKYYTLVAETESHVLECATKLIFNPPKESKYESLKAIIIIKYSEFNDVQMDGQVGNMPSTILKKLREVVDGQVDDAMLKKIWMLQLPMSMQQVLELTEGDLDTLASILDSKMKQNSTSSAKDNNETKSNDSERCDELQTIEESMGSDLEEVPKETNNNSAILAPQTIITDEHIQKLAKDVATIVVEQYQREGEEKLKLKELRRIEELKRSDDSEHTFTKEEKKRMDRFVNDIILGKASFMNELEDECFSLSETVWTKTNIYNFCRKSMEVPESLTLLVEAILNYNCMNI